MKKISNKGFTLIEVLITILIIGVVLGIISYSIISSVNSAKDQSKVLSIKSIKESARTYSNEYNDDTWKKSNTSNNIYFCVTIEELINKGLLAKKTSSIEDDNIKLSDFIVVVKDSTTKVIQKEEILTNSSVDKEAYEYCTGNIKPEDIIKYPTLKDTKTYTDTIITGFTDAEFSTKENQTTTIKEKNCGYSKTSTGDYTWNTTTNDTCSFTGLESNTGYYIKVCMTSEYGSQACSDSSYKVTKQPIDPTISKNTEDSIKITYDDTDIIDNLGNNTNDNHYFKSSIKATSNKDIKSCILNTNTNTYTCNTITKEIQKDTWYKVIDKEIILTYKDSGNVTINAENRDKSNNSTSSTKEFNIYKIIFNKGNADKIGGQTNNIERICLADKNKACSITSPNIEKTGYKIIGWNTNSKATTSSWNVNNTKNINKNETYYPIIEANTYKITYNANNGTGAPNSQTKTYGNNITLSTTKPTRIGYTFTNWNTNSNGTGTSYNAGATYTENSNVTLYAQWRKNKVTIKFSVNGGTLKSDSSFSVDTNGIVTKNGNNLYTVNYNDTVTSSGLPNYNNPSYLNITKDNNIGVTGSEWKCLSGNCIKQTYNQDTNTYKASDFCDASKEDCTITLGVNWEPYKVINDFRCYGNDYYYITTCRGTKCNYTRKNCEYITGTLTWSSIKYCSAETINGNRCMGSDTYYITTCIAASCNYTKKNGVSVSGTIPNRCDLRGSSACINTKTMYVNSSIGLNCRTGAGTSYSIKTAYPCGLPLTVNTVPTNGWYYVTDDGCYVSGDYLVDSISKTNCSFSGGGGSGSLDGKGYLASCWCNTNADCGVSGTEIQLWCDKNMEAPSGMPGKYLCAFHPKNSGGRGYCM